MVAVPPSERLPDAIGGPVLRAAALKGDAAAAYEVGVRFAEGKGMPQISTKPRNGTTAQRRPASCRRCSGSAPSTRRAWA